MSDEDIDFVRRAFEAGNASGWEIEALVPFVHADARFHHPALFPGPREGHGVAGLGELLRQWLSQFDGFRLQTDHLFGHDRKVVALLRAVGTSRASGTDLDWPIGAIFSDFDGGPPREIRWFTDWDETLAAAGASNLDLDHKGESAHS